MTETAPIEKDILVYLASLLDVPVQAERHESDPASFVIVEKVGSSPLGKGLFGATLAAQSYGPTLLAAAQLNEEVKELMQDADDLTRVVSCELNTDYNFTDTASKRYRYQAVFSVTHY